MADRSPDDYSTDYDTEGDDDMQQVMASMPSLTALPLAPTFPQPPATGSGAGLQELQPPQLPPSTFPSALGPAMLEWNALHYKLPASEAEQAEEVAQSPEATHSSDDEPPGLEPVTLMPNTDMLVPRIDVVLPSTGLLMFSMDQLHAALDSRLQTFEAKS